MSFLPADPCISLWDAYEVSRESFVVIINGRRRNVPFLSLDAPI